MHEAANFLPVFEADVEWVSHFLIKLAHPGRAEANQTQPEAWAVILAPG